MEFSLSTRSIVVAFLAAMLALPSASWATSSELAAAQKCRKGVSTQGRNYAKKRLNLMLNCVDKLLKCEIELEVNGTNPNACRSSALTSCTAKIGPAVDSTLEKAKIKFDEKAGKACLVAGVDRMLNATLGGGGLWYANDTSCGSAIDVPTLVACIRGEIEAEVDGLVSKTKPRAALLLDNAGLGSNFPDLTRPPTVDIVIFATAPASGTLVSPGTINLPQGSALKFTGDASTLPCGGSGNNGRLTITVGSGPTAQELQLREPYGSAEVAIFGPYTAAATIPYTIDLKDSGCSDSVSGDVLVP